MTYTALLEIVIVHTARTWERIRLEQPYQEMACDNIESVDEIIGIAEKVLEESDVLQRFLKMSDDTRRKHWCWVEQTNEEFGCSDEYIEFFADKKIREEFDLPPRKEILPASEMLRRIDWKALRRQKAILINMIQSWGEADDPDQRKEAKNAEGLVHLVDAIQDHAVDNLGIEESKVFNLNYDTRYFLVGSEVTNVYEDEGIEEVNLESQFGDVIVVEPSTNLEQIFEEFDGWSGYVEITEDEYNQIKQED